MITLDFSDVPDFEPLPGGDYPIVVDHVEVRYGKDSGQPYLNWELKISEGEHEGRTLFYTTSLQEKALWKVKYTFQTFGLVDEVIDLEIDEDTDYLLDPDFSGEPGIASVTVTVNRGQRTQNVDNLEGMYEVVSEEAPREFSPKPKRSVMEKAPARKPVSRTTKPAVKKPEVEPEDDPEEGEPEAEETEEAPAKKATKKTVVKPKQGKLNLR